MVCINYYSVYITTVHILRLLHTVELTSLQMLNVVHGHHVTRVICTVSRTYAVPQST